MPLTADDLRERIGGYPDNDASFRRAFERDKDELRQLGVTIRVASVPTIDPPVDGYIVDRDEYAGKDPGLEPDELAALHLAAALVRVEELGDDALWKLGGRQIAEEADTQRSVRLEATPQTNTAGVIHDAIAKRQVLSFTYAGVDREFEPSRLSFTRGRWYVSGIDRTRQAERVFRLDRIEGQLEVGAARSFKAQPVRGPQVTRMWEVGDAEPVQAQVQIEREMAGWARLQLHNDEVEEQADGSIIATITVRNADTFRDWVLNFYDNASVLAPPEMRELLTGWLDEMVAQ